MRKKNKLAAAAAGLGGPCPVLHGAQHKANTQADRRHSTGQPSREREARGFKRGGRRKGFWSKRSVLQRIGSHSNDEMVSGW